MAVFHDRQRMEEAIRSLLANGMPTNRIRISQGSTRRDRVARPGRGSLLALGVAIGSMTGAVLTLVWMFWLSDLVVALPLPLIVHRTADAAASGGILGALFAVFVMAAHHKDRYELEPQTDFLVVVNPTNATVADDVCNVLVLRGGELVTPRDETRAVGGYRCATRAAQPCPWYVDSRFAIASSVTSISRNASW